MQSIRLFITQYDRRDASDVRLVIHTPRLYVALHKFERYTAQEQFYKWNKMYTIITQKMTQKAQPSIWVKKITQDFF